MKHFNLVLFIFPLFSFCQDVFFFDTYNSDNGEIEEVYSSFILEDNVVYSVEIEGTYSIWYPEQWYSPCGSPESSAIFPSQTGYKNGTVGFDFNYYFSFPDPSRCRGQSFPQATSRIELTFDGGIDWSHPSAIQSYSHQHIYRYNFVGQGHAFGVRHLSAYNSDDYGQIKFTFWVDIESTGDHLIGVISNLGINGGLENSLIGKIEEALASYGQGDCTTAINVLNALLNQIKAQNGKKLSNDVADGLIRQIELLMAELYSDDFCIESEVKKESSITENAGYKDEVQQLQQGVEIFPNPTNSYIQIELNTDNYTELRIFSVSGQKVMEAFFVKSSMVLDLSVLPAGYYLVMLSGTSDLKVMKLVKE